MLACIGMVLFFAIIGIIGDYDYCDQVVLRMSESEYAWVKETMTKERGGKEPTVREIAHWWERHHNEKP